MRFLPIRIAREMPVPGILPQPAQPLRQGKRPESVRGGDRPDDGDHEMRDRQSRQAGPDRQEYQPRQQ